MSTWEAGEVPENGFKIAWAELKRRTRKPRGEVVYWSYFVFAVCVLGGVGVLLEFARFVSAKETVSPDGLFTAFVTFFPALIGSSAMQIMFDKFKMTFDQPGAYVVKCPPHFGMGMVAVVVVGDAPTNLNAVKTGKMPKKARERLDAALTAAGI
ncbi:MAG: plastocyanin/azurin family copper-binding protein [Allorhizobium sp.]